MLPNWVRLLVEWMSVIAFGLMMFILIQWVTFSFLITGQGYVKWAEGWTRTQCEWLESEGCSE